ncbi:hypothetical protein BDV93DRAFT_556894 [Ceratobasidium sp. AG-I]|nr:hypothetical protein BDV93DRAFT_556894 [Ceratobasidium sp. AG-I]
MSGLFADDLHGAESDDDDDMEDDAAYNAHINDVLYSDILMYEEDENISDSSEQSGSESTHPTIQALELLAEAGITLSTLLDSVLFGDDSIRGDHRVVASRTDLFNSSVLPRSLRRIRKPPQMRVRGQAHQNTKDELESWALETSTEILQKELVQYATTAKAPETEKEVVSEESLKELTFISARVHGAEGTEREIYSF